MKLKKLLTGLFCVLLTCSQVGSGSSRLSLHKQSLYMDMTGAQQMFLFMYHGYNDEYFDGKLPYNTVIKYETPIPDGAEGATQNAGDHYIIYIDSYYNRSYGNALMTLQHEMCHVAVPWNSELDEHGPHFLRCMHQLANEKAFEGIW